jgi:curved DNA-binding protein CbpA/Mrp family chromosome partitioning ATPase
MSSTNLENVEPRPWRADTMTLDIELAKPREENIFAADYYEILRVGPQADDETIERVYGMLADRFHPDNPSTGDPETFLRISEAYETLSNPAKRANYNVLRQFPKGSARFWLRGREFFDGVKGGQNRRLAVLCLLYRRRISTHESPGLTILDLERLTGCTREELTYALWYLCEKRWSTLGEFTSYSITADGFDVVESKLEDRLEFRALATLSYYSLPAELEDPVHFEPRFWISDTVSLDGESNGTIGEAGAAGAIEGAGAGAGAVSIVDHYEILGIGPQADQESIERVYHTLADRFDPDNPGTGDERALLRIKEAYDTLSDHARRAQYNALRQSAKNSTRFRLRGREFFDGIKGEQLRRLAVLCLLYRQSASESPGLTILDLERLTGCTREELGSALWYLREKQWAKSGEFTEYSITAAGFDVVENKVDEREAARSRVWRSPESTQNGDTPGTEFVYTEVSSTPAAERIVESGHADIETEEPSETVEVTQMPIPIEEASEPDGREAVGSWAWLYPEDTGGNERSQPSAPVAPQSPVSIAIAPENHNSHRIAESERTDIKAAEPSDEQPALSQPEVVTPMVNSSEAIAEPAREVAVSARKRVVFSMGGKGGVGKTSVMTGLAEWFEENRIPVTLLDLDTENKVKGSLSHFFGRRAPKINIHTPSGLDAFVDILAEDAPAILADMGSGAGQITHDWFHKMYPDVTEAGVVFTAVGVVTSDPASVESVLDWAAALEHRVAYIIVENNLREHTDFTYWQDSDQAEEFRRRFQPAIIRIDNRLAELEKGVRNYGVTLGQVAARTAPGVELQKASLVMRAQSYRRRMFEEFDKVKELLLP